MTSFDVIRRVRKVTGIRKIGHAGTLDPMATGVLPLLLNKATRLSGFIMSATKAYRAEVTLGQATNTDDAEGDVIAEAAWSHISEADMREALAGFVGGYAQLPPQFSAIRVKGRRAYEHARAGEDVALKARDVVIEAIEQVDVDGGRLGFEVTCGKGTYIRSLARDLGERLGTRAHLSGLRRIASAGFDVSESVPLATLEASSEGGWSDYLVSMFDALRAYPSLTVSEAEGRDIIHGRRVGRFRSLTPAIYRVPIPGARRLLAVVDAQESETYPAMRVFAAEGW